MRRDLATKWQLHSIADLAPHTADLVIGGDYEFFGRREWAEVRAAYDLRFRRTTTFDPTLLYEAIGRGNVDVIAGFSSDGRIAANDLVVLADPEAALPPYDAMLLLGPRVANDPRIACALGDLRGAITVEQMRAANLRVDGQGSTAADAATWLLAQLHLPARDCATAR